MSAEQSMQEISKRPVNPGAEKWLYTPIPVLDYGSVTLIDYMGSDKSIEEAARVSYASGTRPVNATRGLIRYLMRNEHTSPFEMAELKFIIKMPIVVFAQWVRHRTASVNAVSARYSIMDQEFYIPSPENVGIQSTKNRQGRGEGIDLPVAAKFRNWLTSISQSAYEQYEEFLNDDGSGKPKNPEKPMIARELVRMGLPQNLYTRFVWKCDLHNTFHLLGLRMDEHAQWEVRQYANAMGNIVADGFPLSWEAFMDYRFNAIRLSSQEQNILIDLMQSRGVVVTEEEILALASQKGLASSEEKAGIVAKLDKLKIIKQK